MKRITLTLAAAGMGLAAGTASAETSVTLYGIADSAGYTSDAWQALATVCLTPIAAWGPVTVALGIAYYRRRTAPSPGQGS